VLLLIFNVKWVSSSVDLVNEGVFCDAGGLQFDPIELGGDNLLSFNEVIMAAKKKQRVGLVKKQTHFITLIVNSKAKKKIQKLTM
jgi:hypothetical protein